MAGPLTAFIEESYQDTLSLMTELRDYLSEFQAEKPDAADAQLRTRIIGEISSITRHMTEAMAWLLLQKAAAAGEISDSEALSRSDGLLDPENAPDASGLDLQQLPIEIRGYIDRSRRLYDQILKLRDMAEKQAD